MSRWIKGTVNGVYTELRDGEPWVLTDDDEVHVGRDQIRIGDDVYPAHWEICTRCEGHGKHMNPSIDGHGISGDDECWQDDDFTEMYFGGGFDVACEGEGDDGSPCRDGKVWMVDPERLTDEQAQEINRWRQEEYEYRAMVEAERRAGC